MSKTEPYTNRFIQNLVSFIKIILILLLQKGCRIILLGRNIQLDRQDWSGWGKWRACTTHITTTEGPWGRPLTPTVPVELLSCCRADCGFSTPPLLCLTVRRPPKRCSSFISDFSGKLSFNHTKHDHILILGDFNFHVDMQSDLLASEFLNLLNIMNFIQHVSQPTHSRGRTLDLAISQGLSAKVNSVVDVGFSDFLCVFFHCQWFYTTKSSRTNC